MKQERSNKSEVLKKNWALRIQFQKHEIKKYKKCMKIEERSCIYYVPLLYN